MITFRPRNGASDGYQFDLDASERFTRFGGGSAVHPYPPIIGMLSGMLPLYDNVVRFEAFAKNPAGPGSTTYPLNFQWQVTIPGLTKMG
jgi:hypothetical protein